jgi:hypothetical protein
MDFFKTVDSRLGKKASLLQLVNKRYSTSNMIYVFNKTEIQFGSVSVIQLFRVSLKSLINFHYSLVFMV